MCFNAPVSLITGLTAIYLCGYLIYRNNSNDRIFGIAFLFVSFMQILEFLMWKDQDCNGLNQIATKIAFILLWSQPFMFSFATLWGKIWISKIIPILMTLLFSIPLIYSIYYVLSQTQKDNKYWCSRPGSGCHLIWNFFKNNQIPKFLNYDWKYFIGFISFLIVSPIWKGSLILSILVITCLYSVYMYGKTKEYGSIWCWITNFILLLIVYINRKNPDNIDKN